MIKKFDDFISEGFLSKTLNRAKNGEIRTEDKDFFEQESMHEIKNFEGWFLSDDNKLFHYPKIDPIAQFDDFIIKGNGEFFRALSSCFVGGTLDQEIRNKMDQVESLTADELDKYFAAFIENGPHTGR